MLSANILGGPDLWILVGVVLLLFGGKKLPQLARSLGSASSEFKKGLEEGGKDATPIKPADSVAPTLPRPNEEPNPTSPPAEQS